MITCCICDKEANSLFRLRPRRTVTPLTHQIRRALAWPGSAEVVEVPVCGDKQDRQAVRDAAHVILGERPLGTAVHRIEVKDEEAAT